MLFFTCDFSAVLFLTLEMLFFTFLTIFILLLLTIITYVSFLIHTTAFHSKLLILSLILTVIGITLFEFRTISISASYGSAHQIELYSCVSFFTTIPQLSSFMLISESLLLANQSLRLYTTSAIETHNLPTLPPLHSLHCPD